MKIITTITLLLVFTTAFGQKKDLIESKDEITKRATEELANAMQGPEGLLYLFSQEYPMTGIFVFDISVHEKGTVATVFVVSNEGGSIQQQNMLKDQVKNFKFNFKMPKGKIYKFQYTFDFINN